MAWDSVYVCGQQIQAQNQRVRAREWVQVKSPQLCGLLGYFKGFGCTIDVREPLEHSVIMIHAPLVDVKIL